jgi:hypothetical protein
MVKSKNSNDSEVSKIVIEEIAHFNKLIKGHEKLLKAIASL